jgi:hypothetical protein
VKNWECKKHSCLMNSGPRSNRSCPKYALVVGLGLTIARCSKGFSGCSKPEPAGGICPKNIPAPVPVGDGCGTGKSAACGSKFGGSFSVNWTSAASWIGASHFWTAVLLRLKRGRVRRQNQARQGHEVDGGGRRPRYSSGKPTGLGQPGRSDPGGKHAGPNIGAARRQGTAAEATTACRRRPGLRQRSAAQAASQPGNPAHQSSSQRPTQTLPQRWSHSAPLSPPVEDRTHLRLAGQFQEVVSPL